MKKIYAIILAIGFLAMGALAANGSTARSWGPPTIISAPEKIEVTEGMPVSIRVRFSDGGVGAFCEIYKNDQRLTTTSRIQVIFKDDTVTLHITDVDLSDAGTYTFVFTNSLGRVSASIKLYVAMP